jgi:predicted nuclease of predicted toxin-antitoxin system
LSPKNVQLKFFLDAGVPASVGSSIKSEGFQVIFHNDALPEKTADIVVAKTAMVNDAVLVAIDRDMRQLAKRTGLEANRFKRLNPIQIKCNETLAAKRIEQMMSLIMHEWEVSTKKQASRMWIEIGSHHVRSQR